MATKCKLAIAQIRSEGGDIDANLQKLHDYALFASKGNAKLMITPELFITGYSVKPISKLRELATEIPHNFKELQFNDKDSTSVLHRIGCIAIDCNIDLLIGLPERTENTYYNTAIWMSASGTIRSLYRKTHVWGDIEKSIFTQGPKTVPSPYQIVNCFGMNFGVLICYDIEFVEPARILALKGCNCILVLTAEKPSHIVHTIVPSRAVENSLHVVYCNYPTPFGGGSCCVAPNGVKIANAGEREESLSFTIIDTNKYDKLIQMNNYLKDRRSELYPQIIQNKQEPSSKL
eukprot:86677_1